MGTGSGLARLGLLRSLLGQSRLAARLLREPAVPGLLKGVPALAAVYLIWPIDLIPDLLPVLGQLDDVGVILAGLQAFVHLCPDAAAAFHRAAIAAGRRYSPMPPQRDQVIDAEFRPQ
jgi:uncharacterized membrane protein YkvA (DUF1232 family)